MSRLNVNSVNPHDGVKVSITGSTNGGLVISGSPQHDGHPVLRVEGSISASGELTCSNALFTGDIRVIGESTISASAPGGIFLGDTNTDYVVFGADVSSSIIPDLDDRLDLGTSTQEWKDIYIDGVGYIDAIDQDDVSVTNNLKGDWHWKDDSANVSLFVHSADGNVGVKVADPNQEFEVAGRISASQQLSVGGAGTTDGHITASGNVVVSGTLEVLGHTTLQDLTVRNITSSGTTKLGDGTEDYVTIMGNITHSGNFRLGNATEDWLYVLGNYTGSGTHKFGDDTADYITIAGNVTASGNISASSLTATHSFDGLVQIGPAGAPQGKLEVQNLSGESTPALKLKQLDVSQFALRTEGARSVVNHSSLRSNTGDSIIRAGDSAMNGIFEVFGGGTSGKTVFGNNISGSHVTGDHILGGTLTVGTSTIVLSGNAGHITASGNISMSATSTFSIGGGMTISNVTSSGNISGSGYGQFTNVLVEDQNIRKANGVLDVPGPGFNTTTITASSNISSSGQVIGDSGLFADNQIILSSLGDIQALSIKATQNITASSNISASGTIIANKFEADSLVSRVGDANTGIQMTNDTVDIEANDVIVGKFNTSQIQLNTPVTASTNISTSGALVVDSIFSGDITGNSTTTLVVDTPDLYAKGAQLRVDGHITASATISASGASTSFINVLSNKRPTETITNSGGSVTNNMTSAVEVDPSNKVLVINAGADSNNVVMELPAAEAGLSYTFLSVAAPGASTVRFSAPSAILFGVAICDDGNEDISGTHFEFANSKFLRGTRVECISDGSGWSIQAFCLCDVADVSTT